MSTNRRAYNVIHHAIHDIGLAPMPHGRGRQRLVTALAHAALVTGLVCSGGAWSQAAADDAGRDKSVPEKSASERLTQIEAETLVLKAREKQFDVQANILTRQNEIMMKQALHNQLISKGGVGDPLVRSVEGIGKTMYATLQLANGSIVEARAGDVLPNGMKIVSIQPNEVIAESRNKRRTRLGSAF